MSKDPYKTTRRERMAAVLEKITLPQFTAAEEVDQILDELVEASRDPYYFGRRHPDGGDGDHTIEDDANSEVWSTLEGLIMDDEGVFISHSTWNRFQSERENHPRNAETKSVYDKRPGGFISAHQIFHWAKKLKLQERMLANDNGQSDNRRWGDGESDGEDTLHPNSDAQRASSQSLHDEDHWNKVDTSRSSIHIGVTSGDHMLNGSLVQHQHAVRIEITGPSGRRLCEVAMTFEQMAAALFAGGKSPCTLTHYWSVNSDNVILRERVAKPPTLGEKVRSRVAARMKKGHESLAAVKERLLDGKNLGKGAREELARALDISMSNLRSNVRYAVEQAGEEATSIVESAAIHMGRMLGVNADRLGIVGESMQFGGLPAPQPEQVIDGMPETQRIANANRDASSTAQMDTSIVKSRQPMYHIEPVTQADLLPDDVVIVEVQTEDDTRVVGKGHIARPAPGYISLSSIDVEGVVEFDAPMSLPMFALEDAVYGDHKGRPAMQIVNEDGWSIIILNVTQA